MKTAEGDLRKGLAHYQTVRSVEVLKIQNAARNSTEWFENVCRYENLAPEQFAYSLLTRSQRISHENLRVRDAAWLENYEQWFAAQTGVTSKAKVPPMLTPYHLRGVTLNNRVIASPTLLYCANQGVPDDFHLVHLGSRALGGVGLVMTEMTAITPEARVTKGCVGIWSDEQVAAWQRITDFVHQKTDAKIGIQLGHAGRRGSTQRGWEKENHPLDADNWPLVSASALPYLANISQTPVELSEAQMTAVVSQFVAAAKRAEEAGFDWLELQAGQGYLLSSFISPLTNQRTDNYGGTLGNRLRFPLSVVKAVRQVWSKPLCVRISTTDWVDGGTTVDDAVQIARAMKQAGADMIDCSSGEVSPQQQPIYGRMYQTPMADRIRNEAGIPVIAVGAITDADQVNSIIAAGRADLCALSRPLLSDSAWVLHECARYGWETCWPAPYEYGRQQLVQSLKSR